MTSTNLSLTDARRLLPGLIHDLERHPDRVYRISVRKRWVAELKAPPLVAKRGLAAARLLALARKHSAKGRRRWHVSEDVDRHLYE